MPGLPVKTMCRLMGALGRPAASRSLRTLMRFTRLRTSRFTLSRPISESSSAMSASKSGFSAGFSSAAASGAAASPEG